MKKLIALVLVTVLVLSGCGTTKASETKESTLHVYCGAGMTEPFKEIVDEFMKENDIKVEITFANIGQINNQINTSEQGDAFVCASHKDLEAITDHIVDTYDLVKHIPALAVAKGNPKNITGIMDLTREDVKVVLGNDSAAVGRVAKKVLSDFGITDKINLVAKTPTAPSIYNALATGECDAIITWKDNVKEKGEIVGIEDMAKYEKIIPIVTLEFSENEKELGKLIEFLQTDKSKEIWAKYGYESVN